jgi:predicted DNA-binding protein (MmcQ/YjbR family)
MTPAAFDALALSLPGATMTVQWGVDQVYKVGGKMFAVLGPNGTASFKANDVAFEMLVETGAGRPAPYMARAKWVFFDNLAGLSDEEWRQYLTTAHELTAAKLTRKARAELGLA